MLIGPSILEFTKPFFSLKILKGRNYKLLSRIGIDANSGFFVVTRVTQGCLKGA